MLLARMMQERFPEQQQQPPMQADPWWVRRPGVMGPQSMRPPMQEGPSPPVDRPITAMFRGPGESMVNGRIHDVYGRDVRDERVLGMKAPPRVTYDE
jgi:hypothetical protein